MYDYVWLCMTMYDYVMYGYLWLCLTMYNYIWLCLTMFDYVCPCITMYDFVWEAERKREREQEQFYKLFSSFCKNFQKIKLFRTIQMFWNLSYFSINLNFVYLCLPLFTLVHLCFPLLTSVQITHLCTNFVLVF